MRNFRSKTSLRARKLQLLLKIDNPTLNQVQSADWPIQWVSQIFPWFRPFLAGLCAFSGNKKCGAQNWQKIVDCALKIWALFFKSPRFPTPRSFLRNRLKIEIYTDACDRAPFGKESINWASGIGIWGNSSHKRYIRRNSLARSKRKIPRV